MADFHDPLRVFERSFSARQQLGILKTVTVGWHLAYKHLRGQFDQASFHDVFPHYRRAQIEQDLRGFAVRHAMEGPARPNHARNCFHTELLSGRTILTASAVDSPEQMVRNAIFRNTLARDPQLSFLDEETAPKPGDPLYGIILYGQPGRDQRFPGFVRIGFPDQDCREYRGLIDLIGRFSKEYVELQVRLRRDAESA